MGEHTLRSHPDRILERLNGAFNTRDEVPYATWSGVAVKLVLLGQDPPQFPRMHLWLLNRDDVKDNRPDLYLIFSGHIQTQVIPEQVGGLSI